MIGVVITAAGTSRRFGGSTPKVLAPLCGRRVIDWTVDAWKQALEGESAALVVTLPGKHVDAVDAVPTVAGGATRQESVQRGCDALPASCTLFVVHDGARPLVSADTIRATIHTIRARGAAAVVLPVTDSLHRGESAGDVPLGASLKRDALVAAQTPQGALRTHMETAWRLARETSTVFTDEAALLHGAGIDVWPVKGRSDNMKITTRADLAVAEALLSLRRRHREAPA